MQEKGKGERREKWEMSEFSRPTRLFLTPERQLAIDWSDGLRRLYTAGDLRLNCPCAMCQTQRPDASGSTPFQAAPELAIASIDPVGSYGYKIRFSDGHDTGIFTIEFLRKLGAPAGP
jgi:DUF971 family protein